MQKTLLLLITSCFIGQLWAQSPDLKIHPDPLFQSQCPNYARVHTIFPWASSCPVSVTIIGGELLKQSIVEDRLNLTITWHEAVDSMPGRIELVWGDSLCGGHTFNQAWSFHIIPLDIKPVIHGGGQYYIGTKPVFSLTATLDLLNLLPYSFEWQLPESASPTHSTYGDLDFFIPQVDTLHKYCIKVRSALPCNMRSDWTEHCIQGILPAPCPLQLAKSIFLCGDTTETLLSASSIALPQIPQYTWSPLVYTWTLPPGWTIANNNLLPANHISVKPDGHTNGSIAASVTTNGLPAEACDYTVTFLPADPATVVVGPDFVCQSGDFSLSIPPPKQANITWQVSPLDPATPPVVVPNQGSGPASFQISDPAISGYFQITYTIATDCGTTTRSKVFFVGKPSFSNTTLDGAAYSAQPLCPGGHGINTETRGIADLPVIWSTLPALNAYPQRDSLVFFLAPTEAVNCTTVTATAENVCGISTLPLEICPQPGCGQPPIDLLVYPNPAIVIVSLEVTSADLLTEDYALIGKVEVFNHLGQLVSVWNESPRRRLVKAIADLPGGWYTLRATVWDQIIMKPMLIAH